MNRNAKRWLPNCAVGLSSSELNAVSSAPWIVAAVIDVSKIFTLGPKSGVSEVGIVDSLMTLNDDATSLKLAAARLALLAVSLSTPPP